MTSVFNEYVFPRFQANTIFKPNMNGLNDPTLKNFSLLNSSVLMKSELKDKKFEDEFIESFMHAAKTLAAVEQRERDLSLNYVFHSYSCAIPVLYLTRHCMELSIKRALSLCGLKPPKKHGLQDLWNCLLSNFPKQNRNAKDSHIFMNMSTFVNQISEIDSNGISLRYSKDSQGNLTQDKALFVNDLKAVSYLEKFVKQLESLNF